MDNDLEPSTSSPSSPNGVMADAIEVIESRTPAGVGFSFKVRETGRLYRLEPMRHPRQPRFWCFRIFRCLPGGRPDPTERPWLGGSEMSLSELPDEVAAIRADVEEWLARQEHRDLRDWVFAKPVAVAKESGPVGP